MKSAHSQMMLQELIKKYSNAPDFYGQDITTIESRTSFGDQLIHAASVTGDINDVDLLLSMGADINVQGDMGYTPLHYAVEQNHPELVIFLLKNKASPLIMSHDGETPYELAQSLNHINLYHLFERTV